MATTIFLLLLFSFELCYLTSKQARYANVQQPLLKLMDKPKQLQFLALFLLFVSFTLAVAHWGIASGIIGILIGLMAAGSLIVAIQPFRYIKFPVLAGLYLFILVLEFLI